MPIVIFAVFVVKNAFVHTMIYCIKNSYGSIDKSVHIGPVNWPHFDLIFVHSGQIQLILMNRKQTQLDSGQAIMIYPETPFNARTITPTAKLSVHHFSFDGNSDFSSAIKSLQNKKNGYKTYRQCNKIQIERDIERVVALTYKEPLPADKDTRCLLMTLIITQLQSATPQHKHKSLLSPEFEKLTDFMRKNLAKNITLDNMAEYIGLSTSHFRFVFRNQTGTSPGSYLLNMRINEAARLLRETLMPIKKIALLTGYKDIAHFYHSFKANFKTTPKLYRQKHTPLG